MPPFTIAMEFVEGETLEHILQRKRPRGDHDTRGLGSRLLTSIQRAFAAMDTVEVPSGLGDEPTPDGSEAEDDSRSTIPATTEGMDLSYCIRMARTFAGVAEGLQHAHSKGIVHRDLKPSNLILDTDGNLRILDFGLAHLEGQESLTGSGEIVGTPGYMSPEQARARVVPIDHGTDIYNLGATLYELLTLRAPFRGKTAQETLSQILHRDPRPRRAHNALVRINCGGSEYTSDTGQRWSRDRFFNSGRTANILAEIRGSNILPVHQTERYYPGGTRGPAGYRIPLPIGRYRLTLRFTEIFAQITAPGQRVFDVVIEGEKRIADYDVFVRVGHSTLDLLELPVTVSDGALDIEFVRKVELPKITAIEIVVVP